MSENKRSNLKRLKKTVITEIRKKKKGFINPVLVTFQNGEINQERASDFKVHLSLEESGETKVEVVAPYGHVFKETDYGDKSTRTQILAIRNRTTNKMRIIEVDSALLINTALLKTTQEKAAVEDNSKQVRTLNKTFGGKKIMTRLEQREKLNINSMLGADEMKEAISVIKVEDTLSPFNNETESITDLLPPCHRSAKVLSEVYVLNEILTYDELESLKAEVINNLLEKKKLNPKEYSDFFLLCFEKAKESEESEDIYNKLAGLLFAETLIKFLKIPIKKLLTKKLVLCSFSTPIHSKLLNEFCIKTDSSISRPQTLRDKSLCYVIAVALICCNYQINLKLLSRVTSVHLNKLSRLARVVGAVPLSKDEQEFVLKLPLPALPKSTKVKVQRK